jgi:hypothetical protein
MLIRRDDRGVLAIGQASHAWISGQLARAWGNERFGTVEPWEEVCLAAEQHDLGMALWDLEPSHNPDTGLPHSFLEMPLEVHVELWRQGPPRLESQCPYAALLVSMHGRRLYERRDLDALEPSQAGAVRSFIDTRRSYELRLANSLHADPELLQRNSQLIWIWDYVSLALCLDWAPAIAKRVPSVDGAVDLELARTEDRLRAVTLHPWPLCRPALTMRCQGRRLRESYDDERSLREAFASAPWETAEFDLLPLS